MTQIRSVIAGPWRAVLVLGVTQILCWGTLFYPPVLTLPLIAADRGWSIAFAMGGFSLGLLTAGLAAPFVGRAIDRHGGHRVMTVGSLLGCAGFIMLVIVEHPVAYLAVWLVLGLAIAASLYDPAFATLGRIFGAGARAPITVLTFAGGFASTASWPATYLLIAHGGWRATYLAFAALLALVAAPLHALALPRTRAAVAPATAPPPAPSPQDAVPSAPAPAVLRPRGLAFLTVAAAFAAYSFVPSGLSAHLLAMFGRAGIEAATVVAIGALFGPAQVLARVAELVFARGVHPLVVARMAVAILLAAFTVVAVFGVYALAAAAFMIMFGVANGLITIARGTVPLALFGPAGYGALIGRIAAPCLAMQAIAPLVMAVVIERASDAAALALVALLALMAFACLMLLRAPR
ncbi:MAG: MFS transporter [Hyphomicrobiales bacterium]|nr:MFS transporter [Hyphomicrobiales bacterium]